MKQLLRLNQIRSTHRTSVEATVRALLIAWALHESTTTWLRPLVSATASPESVVVSSWLVSGLGLETLRQQVQGRWSEARLQACLPVCTAFSAVVHGVGGVRNPPCEPGWNSEPVHALTDGQKRHEVGVGHRERAVSSRLWAHAPPAAPPAQTRLRSATAACGPWPSGPGGAHT